MHDWYDWLFTARAHNHHKTASNGKVDLTMKHNMFHTKPVCQETERSDKKHCQHGRNAGRNALPAMQTTLAVRDRFQSFTIACKFLF